VEFPMRSIWHWLNLPLVALLPDLEGSDIGSTLSSHCRGPVLPSGGMV
jgi:hypothetical protein